MTITETVVTPEVVVAVEPVKEKKPRKRPEPKAKVDEAIILEEARKQAYEIARQAEIHAAMNTVEEDDDKSHHTVKLPDDEEEEEEIHAREFIFNGAHYLIDENTNDLYDIETQDMIGRFDKTANQIYLNK